ncbi:SprT-like domain-containing protein [Halostella litorea]|uniref:SprT-like domain-containing protein n=1 Tax=Halostella litorea TaxID=2528831 RepID=UPI00109257D9|nr:SprT-like domain-containing protein [Halostella litorea]
MDSTDESVETKATTRSASEGASARTASAPTTRAEFLERARSYAESVAIDVDTDSVEWELSERAKRRAGVCLFDRQSESVTIRLTWAAYEEYGWKEFTEVIRHELVHAWEFQHFGESTHGERFQAKAAELDVPRHCRSFSDARLVLRCTDPACSWRADRHRASESVTDPEQRRCGACRGRYVVEHVDTGIRWRTNEGYEDARERIGDDW